jgi:hypothetical protein
VGLAGRAKRVLPTILSLVVAVRLDFLEAFIDSGERNEFEQTTAVRSTVAFPIGSKSAVVRRASSKEMTIQTITVFDLEDVREDWMVEKVLPHVPRIDHALNAESFEV